MIQPRRGLWPVLTALTVVGLMLTACGGGAQPSAEATKPPEEAKVATFVFTQEFDTLNPAYTNQFFSVITHQLWNCWAWDFDDQNRPRPVLVTEIPSLENGGLSQDGRVITMKLRPDFVWSDGDALTSDDLVFTSEMHTSPKNAVSSAYPYDQIESITAPDPTTVVITFKEPFAPWAGTLWHGILPEHILRPVFEQEGTLDSADWNREPTVGCGPYVFAEWESGSYARFVANGRYWLGRRRSTRSSSASCRTTLRRLRR